jgi:hypothetical protein
MDAMGVTAFVQHGRDDHSQSGSHQVAKRDEPNDGGTFFFLEPFRRNGRPAFNRWLGHRDPDGVINAVP